MSSRCRLACRFSTHQTNIWVSIDTALARTNPRTAHPPPTFEWVYPLPSRASELLIFFLVRERAHARGRGRGKARTNRPPSTRAEKQMIHFPLVMTSPWRKIQKNTERELKIQTTSKFFVKYKRREKKYKKIAAPEAPPI